MKGYKIGTKPEPPVLTENIMNFEKDWLDERLDFDLAWCMAANYTADDGIEMPPLGSWTVFNSMTTDKRTVQSDLDLDHIHPTSLFSKIT